jgi:pterin-4a-carbinolamine dehydratase
MPPPQSLWLASFPRRNLYLSSTCPITISDDRKTITLNLSDGSIIRQKFSPTPKAKLDKLCERLPKLLQTLERSPVAESLNEKEMAASSASFGTAEWCIDPEGDAIHRHIAHTSTTECDAIDAEIMHAADGLNHHPHITRGRSDNGEYTLMTITCTTHSPRGLSVRDLRLAEMINEILAKFKTVAPWNADTDRDPDADDQTIAAKREHLVSLNRHKINEALEQCGCETAKTTSPAISSDP